MKSRYSRWTCTISAMAVALGACAPVPVPEPAPAPAPGAGFFTGVSLPAGPLNQLPRAVLRGLGEQVTWEGCTWAARTSTTPTPTVIQICAASYSRILGRGNTANTGVLTARLVNFGTSRDARWNLTSGDTSYIISFPKAASEGEYAILEVSANSVPGDKVRVVKENGLFRYCQHGGAPATSSASFYTCERKRAMHGRSATSDAGSGPSADDDALIQDLDGPAWVSCSAGCCTTEAS